MSEAPPFNELYNTPMRARDFSEAQLAECLAEVVRLGSAIARPGRPELDAMGFTPSVEERANVVIAELIDAANKLSLEVNNLKQRLDNAELTGTVQCVDGELVLNLTLKL